MAPHHTDRQQVEAVISARLAALRINVNLAITAWTNDHDEAFDRAVMQVDRDVSALFGDLSALDAVTSRR